VPSEEGCTYIFNIADFKSARVVQRGRHSYRTKKAIGTRESFPPNMWEDKHKDTCHSFASDTRALIIAVCVGSISHKR
jgi:hypothetical protein